MRRLTIYLGSCFYSSTVKKLKKQGKARLQQQNDSSRKSQLCFDEKNIYWHNSINIISEGAQNNFSLLTERSDKGNFEKSPLNFRIVNHYIKRWNISRKWKLRFLKHDLEIQQRRRSYKSRDPAGVKKCQNLDLLFDNNFDFQIKNLASENEGKCQQDKFYRPPPVNSIR